MLCVFFRLALFYSCHIVLALPTQTPSSECPLVKDLVSNISYYGVSSMGVESFLNIRFGQDTGGNNRFAAPKPFEYECGAVVNATSPGAACPQQKVPIPEIPIFSNVTYLSEDCLTIRVDRPAGITANAKLPVLLYVYGGGDTIGQIYDRAYDPTGLVLGSASKGLPIIYAAMNYRLGFFGFSAFAGNASDAVPNAGLLDQRLGMEWVQKHIASFGGDPDNVTIFGESDGASAVGLHITAFGGKQPAPFKRAIMESGSATAEDGIASNTTWVRTQELTDMLNCSNTNNDTSASIACLRSLSLDELLPVEINYTFALNPFGGFNVFFSVVDNTFVPAPPSQLLANGNFSKDISTIIGWNEDDGSVFVPSPDQFANSSYLPSWILSQFPGFNDSGVATILSLYAANSSTFTAKKAAYPTLPVDWLRASQIFRDTSFVCPALLMAQALTKYSTAGSDTSSYLYNLNASLFTPFLAAQNHSYLGITHFSDIPYVFNQATGYNASYAQIALASQVSGSWAQFAYSGQPTSRDRGVISRALTLSDWPIAINGPHASGTCSTSGTIIKIIGGDGQSIVTVGSELDSDEDFEDIGRRCAFWNSPGALEALAV